MKGFGLSHGETRRRVIKVSGMEVIRHEIYCRLHGWLDTFLVGDKFEEKHKNCGMKPCGRAFAMKAAA